ncbi:MAG: MFS transporter [Chloroflexi bacterium]|nr:MFS transporter [Chloroflexota bacterium]
MGERGGTFAALRNKHFRLLWISMLFSFTAIQMMITAQGFLTFELTGTATSLGLVSLGWGIPQLAFTLIGGVAADRLHKRWLTVISQAIMAVTSAGLAVLIQTDVIAVWHVFIMALITGTVFAFNVPARQAWIPELVGEARLMNAVALNTTAFTLTGTVGPALAGVLIAVPFVGLTGVYYLMAGCYGITAVLLARIPGGAPSEDAERSHPVQELFDGVRYVRRHPVLPTLMLMGFVAIVLGMPYRLFFPVFIDEVYGAGPVGLGMMGLFMALGALVGSLGVASLSTRSKRVRIQIIGGLGFGVALILFAAAPVLWMGLLTLLLVGLASNGYWALNNTMVLGASDHAYFGRVMSIYMLSWSVMPFVALPQSALADAIGVQVMMAGVGVLLFVVLAIIVVVLPGYRRLSDQEARGMAKQRTSTV